MDSLDFLDRPPSKQSKKYYILHAEDDFLKRQVLTRLKQHILGEESDDLGLTTFVGEKATFAEVHDELDTLPLFGSQRFIVVEQADPFVTRYRAQLEKALANPDWHSVLVMDVKSWPANTKLAKLVDKSHVITCKTPPESRLPEWCVSWAARHGAKLALSAARLLVDLVGTELGQLDQELAKLAVYVSAGTRIESQDVDQLVGRSRAANVFRIFKAIGEANAAAALAVLDQLFDQGEEPLRILGAISFQARRLILTARLTRQGTPLQEALGQAGVQPFAQRETEQQVRHLGRRRLNRLSDWLLEVDAGLKGSSQLSPRILLERFIVRLARPSEPARHQ